VIQAPDLDAALEWGGKLAAGPPVAFGRGPAAGDESERACDAPRADLPSAEIARVFRDEYGRAVAVLVRHFGDIDLAEEAVQDAFAAALARWPDTGVPPSPAGWIITTARNRGIDRLRREASRQDPPRQAAREQVPDTARRTPCGRAGCATTGCG